MNIEDIETSVTVSMLYKIIGQERIMSYYFKQEISLTKRYCNPFRDDSTPGCFFKWSKNGNLNFMDYATAQVCYSPIDVAMLVTGYGYPDILYKIESDFSLKNLNLSDRAKLMLEAKEIIIPEVKPAIIKVKVTPFLKADLQYWEQFGITKTILDYYDVRKVDRAWINDDLWYINNSFDPCYRYKEKDRFKLYRPFADKRVKFRTNYFGGLLEGYTQLPTKGSNLVITKGSKDVMTLHSLGINAVAVRSENTPMSENAYEILKHRFENLYLWFDADEAGINGAKKMSEKFGIPFLQHDGSLGKDPSDIYKNHGKEKLLEICKQLEII